MYYALVEIFHNDLTSIKIKVIKNYWGKNILSILMYIFLFLKKKTNAEKASITVKEIKGGTHCYRKLLMGGFHFIHANEKDTQW